MRKFPVIVVMICMMLTVSGMIVEPSLVNDSKPICSQSENNIQKPTLRLEDETIPTTYNNSKQMKTKTKEPDLYSSEDAVIIAKIIYAEARGVYSQTEQACVAWIILNRYDSGYGSSISSIATSPNQFAYYYDSPTIDDYGRDLVALAADVLDRWQREKQGESEVGRVLPLNYIYFGGNGLSNSFCSIYNDFSNVWNYTLESPYSS